MRTYKKTCETLFVQETELTIVEYFSFICDWLRVVRVS